MLYSVPRSKNTINYYSFILKPEIFSHSYEEVHSDVLLRVYQITRRHITESPLYRFLYVVTLYRALWLVLSSYPTLWCRVMNMQTICFKVNFRQIFFPVCRKFLSLYYILFIINYYRQIIFYGIIYTYIHKFIHK